MTTIADTLHELRLAPRRLRKIRHLKHLFREKLGYEPNFRKPRTFNEKVNTRKLYDRNPLFPILVDKLAVRDFVAERLGQVEAARLLLPVLSRTQDPTPEWIAAQGTGVAIKANHGCGWNQFVRPGQAVDAGELSRQMQGWLRRVHGAKKMEWAYALVEPWAFSEPLILGSDGRVADDIKFTVMDGTCRLIQIEQDRFGVPTQHFLSPEGETLSLQMQRDGVAPMVHLPVDWRDLRAVAERIAESFDYLRVDFLFSGSQWALNELTIYRGSGLNPFRPVAWDWDLGAQWQMRMVPRRIGQA